jgi:hypothetical protein
MKRNFALRTAYDFKKERVTSDLRSNWEVERAVNRDSALLSAPVIYGNNENDPLEEIIRDEESSGDEHEARLHRDQDISLPKKKFKGGDPSKTHFGNFGTMGSLDDVYLS